MISLYNFLFIVVDCLRADHVSAYGYKRETTPNIDKLAKKGVLFRRAYTQSTFTLTSAASILTGVYPQVHGLLRFKDKISSGLMTLPEYLRRHGYDTTCFQGANLFSGRARDSPGLVEIGFDKANFLEQEKAKRRCRQATCDEVYSRFSSYIEDVHTPFFSLIWFFDAHGAYGKFLLSEKNMAYLGKSGNARVDRYDSELKFVDHYVGRVVEALDKNCLMDETLVIITADHGDVFDEHRWFEGSLIGDTLCKFPYFERILSRDGYLGHLDVLPYEEVIHVPLIMKFPKEKHKSEIEGQVELIDIYPTVLEFLNSKRERTRGIRMVLQGRSVVSLLENGPNSSRRVVYCCTKPFDYTSLFVCAKDDKFKLMKVYSPNVSLKNFRGNPKRFLAHRIVGGERFFETGSSEKVDVSNKHPVYLRLLRKNLLQWQRNNMFLREKVRTKNVIRRLETACALSLHASSVGDLMNESKKRPEQKKSMTA